MRLIDVDKLRSVLEDNIRCSSTTTVADRYYCDGLRNALLCVMSRPIVEERKHGHWITVITMLPHHRCSVCNRPALCSEFTDVDVLSDYCPYCGAKMDEEANGVE